jgi:hypothetical protein
LGQTGVGWGAAEGAEAGGGESDSCSKITGVGSASEAEGKLQAEKSTNKINNQPFDFTAFRSGLENESFLMAQG